MDLLSLAPYGLAPLAAAYGASRLGRAAYSSVRKGLPARKRARARIPTSLKLKGTHTFRRSTFHQADITPSLGFVNGALNGNAIVFTFSLAEIRMYIGAGSVVSAIPSYTEFTTLFDCWRVKSVKLHAFFQNTNSPTSQITTCAPLLHYVWDSDDHVIPSLGDVNQYTGVKRYQFCNGASKGGALVTTGRPHATSTGVMTTGGSAGTKTEPLSTWMETAQSGIEFNSLKMVFDSFGATQATPEGRISFYFDIVYEFKDVV